MLFHLTPVWSRKDELNERLARSKRLFSGEEELKLKKRDFAAILLLAGFLALIIAESILL